MRSGLALALLLLVAACADISSQDIPRLATLERGALRHGIVLTYTFPF